MSIDSAFFLFEYLNFGLANRELFPTPNSNSVSINLSCMHTEVLLILCNVTMLIAETLYGAEVVISPHGRTVAGANESTAIAVDLNPVIYSKGQRGIRPDFKL